MSINKTKQLVKLRRNNKHLKRKINNLIKYRGGIDKKIRSENNEPLTAYYKYTSQKSLLLLLRNKKIKITNPLEFNDPMDSTIPNIDINDQLIKRIIKSGISEEFPTFINQFKSEVNEKLSFEFRKLKKELKIHSDKLIKDWSVLIGNFRVLSLTTKEKNLLMWSHYADEHKGVVIKFKQKLSLGNPIKVDYHNGYQSLNNFFNMTFAYIAIKEIHGKNSEVNVDNISNITVDTISKYLFMKMSEWSYENEYRIVYHKDHDKINKINKINKNLDVLNVSDDDIECITIGSSVSPLRAKRLKLLIKSKFPNTQVKHYRRIGWDLKSEEIN